MRCTILLLTSFLFLQCGTPEVKTRDYLNTETVTEFNERMAWWREARFGMFIHWGAYAVPAGSYQGKEISGIGEWIMNSANIPIPEYEKFVHQFNPVDFDAEEWVRIAKDAGMKYIVITSKHHDGFCLWDSKVTEYDIMDASPYKKDLLKMLQVACEKEGIKLCFYHSIMDWHHPDAQGTQYPDYNEGAKGNPNFQRYVDSYLKPQIRELIENYDPAILWFDGEWINEWTHEHGVDLYNYCRSLKPDILINNRVDKGRQGMQGMNKTDQKYAGDFGTPEQEILDGASSLDWESCMTMNDTWGYKSYDHNWKSSDLLIQNLADIAAKGGNYLLNVGPTAEGIIPAPSVERLADMGSWMRQNGEAIYGSKLWASHQDGEYVRYTQTHSDDSVYAIVFKREDNVLELRYVQPEDKSEIWVLGYPRPLTWTWQPQTGLNIQLPDDLPQSPAYVFKMAGKPAPVAESPQIGSPDNPDLSIDIFSDQSTVVLSSPSPGARIYYSLDGSRPGPQSTLYEGPFIISSTTMIKAISLHDDMVMSQIAQAEFRKSRYNGIKLKYPYSQNYPAGGPLALLDGFSGSTNFKDGNWQGYSGVDLHATLDLGTVQPITHVQASFLKDQGVWIFLPESLEVSISQDGETFTSIYSYDFGEPTPDGQLAVETIKHSLTPEKQARFVRFHARSIGKCPEWHGGAGGEAWLFADELTVE